MTISARLLDALPGFDHRRAGWWRWRQHLLVKLLSYAGRHRKYALLTAVFGTLGFALSFVYPWIIGSAIDLILDIRPAGSPVASCCL